MNRAEARTELLELDRQIQKAIYERGNIIKKYIEANPNRFETVTVQNRQGEPITVLRITRFDYYYQGGGFYHFNYLPQEEGQDAPVVDSIVGEDLIALWQNHEFVRNVFSGFPPKDS